MRRPADGMHASPRQTIWAEVRRRPGKVASGAISDRTGILCKTVSDYIVSLARAGFLELAADAAVQRDRVYRLVRDVGHEAPRVRRDGSAVAAGGGTEAMWRTMHVLGDFTAAELAQHATTDRSAVSEATAATYLSILARAGYLRTVRPAQSRLARPAVYRLIRRTGPRPPQVQRVKRVYDPNTGEVHGAEVAPESLQASAVAERVEELA